MIASRTTPRPVVLPLALSTVLLALQAAALSPAPLAGQQLSEEEQRIVAWADAHTDEAIGLLERVVNINSGTLNLEGVRRVGSIFSDQLDDIGFETEWVELPETGRAGHLFARHDGDRGRKVLLIGHLDTVFEEDDAFQTFERDGDQATGPGVSDMKSGDVVIVYALKALAAAGALEGSQIVVALTGDEERPGSPLEVARRDLVEAGQWADVALGFEGGARDEKGEYATIARRSSSDWVLEVTGRQAHSSGIFGDDVGAGAIFEASRILDAFYEEVRGEQYLTFNAGIVLGGTDVEYDPLEARGTAFGKTNVVPNRVVVHGGIRTISQDQLDRAREAMRRVVARHLPHTDATITFEEGYPAMSPTEGNRALYEIYDRASRDLGLPGFLILDPGRRGAADISFVAPYADGLAGLGIYGGGAHTPQERLDLTSVGPAIKRAALLIYRLTREGAVSQ